jgi:hypothetical protein
MNQQVNLQDYPLQTGWNTSLKPYPNCQFVYLDCLDHQFANIRFLTQTQTRNDSVELLVALIMSSYGRPYSLW